MAKDFIDFFMFSGIVFSSDDELFGSRIVKDVRIYLQIYLDNFCDVQIHSYYSYKYSAQVLACASIALSRRCAGLSPIWPEELVQLTLLEFEDFRLCY